jgi:hypothetical protein
MKSSRRSKQKQQTLALLKILALGNRQIEQGQVVRAADAFARVPKNEATLKEIGL